MNNEYFENDDHRYEDMLDLPHHVSQVHPPMSRADRAAQFSPFAALTGFGETIRETGRITQERVELGEDARNLLDEKLGMLREHIDSRPRVTLTYFQQDEKKAGGAYHTVTGRIKKIDAYERMVVMEDGIKLPVSQIMEIEWVPFSCEGDTGV